MIQEDTDADIIIEQLKSELVILKKEIEQYEQSQIKLKETSNNLVLIQESQTNQHNEFCLEMSRVCVEFQNTSSQLQSTKSEATDQQFTYLQLQNDTIHQNKLVSVEEVNITHMTATLKKHQYQADFLSKQLQYLQKKLEQNNENNLDGQFEKLRLLPDGDTDESIALVHEVSQQLIRDNEALIEHEYTMIELNYRRKEFLIESISNCKTTKYDLQTKIDNLKRSTQLSDQLQEVRSYQTELDPIFTNQIETLDYFKSLLCAQADMQLLMRLIQSDEVVNKSKEFQHLQEHAEITNVLEFEQNKLEEHDKVLDQRHTETPDIIRRIHDLKQKSFQAKVQFAQAEKDLDFESENLIKVQQEHALEKALSEKQLKEFDDEISSRLKYIQDQNLQTKHQIEQTQDAITKAGLSAFKLNAVKSLIQAQFDERSAKNQQQTNNKTQLRSVKAVNEVMVTGIQMYIKECEEHSKQGKDAFELLKDKRIYHVAEAIKMHLDESSREAFCDTEIAQLQAKMQVINQEIEEYNKQKSELQRIQISLDEIVQQTEDSKNSSTSEFTLTAEQLNIIQDECRQVQETSNQIQAQTDSILETKLRIESESASAQLDVLSKTAEFEQLINEITQINQSIELSKADHNEQTQSITVLDTQMQQELNVYLELLTQHQQFLITNQSNLSENLSKAQQLIIQNTSNLAQQKQNYNSFRVEKEGVLNQIQKCRQNDKTKILESGQQYFEEVSKSIQQAEFDHKSTKEIRFNRVVGEIAMLMNDIKAMEEAAKQAERIRLAQEAEKLRIQEEQAEALRIQIEKEAEEERLRQEAEALRIKLENDAETLRIKVEKEAEEERQRQEQLDIAEKIRIEAEQAQELKLKLAQEAEELRLRLEAEALRIKLEKEAEEERLRLEAEANQIFVTNDFDLDQQIQRKRSSEKRSRSNSIDKQEVQKSPEELIQDEKMKIKQKYATYELSQIEEGSQENFQSEYGSEAGGFELGRSGSTGNIGFNSNILLNEKLKQKKEDTTLKQAVQSPSEVYRPSIFDMQRKTNQQGSYRATTYDKTPVVRRIGQALANKFGGHGSISGHNVESEETVLGDLLICQLAQKSILNIHSDFELSQGYVLFEQLYQSDSKCHEAMFGLARINYIQGRYEYAEKLLIKAYETKRDFAYRVWLGFTQLQICKVCTVENPKKVKSANNAFQNLERCSKEAKVSLFANFGLLYIALFQISSGWKIQNCQEPAYYVNLIKEQGRYEGILAQAVVSLKTNQTSIGVKQLQDLIQSNVSRPHAHYLLINHYLQASEFTKARQTAEDAYKSVTEYVSFQERLLLTLQLCKCLVRDSQGERALLMLQMQYTESPHFNSLLYLYGKYIVQTQSLHQQYLVNGISALQEVKRISCQVRSAKASYWLSEAYAMQGQTTLCGIQQSTYYQTIRQIVKNGSIRIKPIKSPVIDVTVQMSIKKAIQDLKFQIVDPTKDKKDPLLVNPTASIEGQSLEAPLTKIADLVIACSKINNIRDQKLYRAIALYRLKQEIDLADQLFLELLNDYPEDVEIQTENLKFLRYLLKLNKQITRQKKSEDEANRLQELIKSKPVSGDMWATALIECAKLYSKISKKICSAELQIKAFECLLEIKQVLPVIDTKLAAVKLPGSTDRYLSDEFDQIDFQVTQAQVAQIDQVSTHKSSAYAEFKPQCDYDDTNKFFFQTRYAQEKLLGCPLATLSIAEISGQTRIKGDQVFYFGSVQTDLACNSEVMSKMIGVHGENQFKYYKSSTPLIAVVKYLQHIAIQNNQQFQKEIEPSSIIDQGFCVRSDPDFLYLIAKMCWQSKAFIDLAIMSLNLYQQLMSYYRNFNDWNLRQVRFKLMLALVLKEQTESVEDKQVVQGVIKELEPQLRKAYELSIYLPSNKVTRSEYTTQKTYKLLQAVL